jgi:hypothetical protein
MTFSTVYPPAVEKSVRTYYVKGWIKHDSLDITITEEFPFARGYIKDNLYEFVAFKFN